MPFAFSQVSPKNTGRVSRVEIPFTNYLGVAFEQGMHDSMFASISQIREMDLEREGPRITADEANERYGLPGLKFDTSVYESEAKLINERKQAEMRRNFYLEQGAPGGTWSKRGLAGLGTSMIASMLNPLDFSMNFMPVVGSEKMALQAQRLGRGAFRQALARGLLTTEEAIARRIPIAPRLTSSLIQGFVGNVAAEVPHFISSVQSKENYTVSDAAVNILGGTAIGGALHLAMTSAARILEKTTMPTRDAMMRKAVDDFTKGKSPEVAQFVAADENIVKEKATDMSRRSFIELMSKIVGAATTTSPASIAKGLLGSKTASLLPKLSLRSLGDLTHNLIESEINAGRYTAATATALDKIAPHPDFGYLPAFRDIFENDKDFQKLVLDYSKKKGREGSFKEVIESFYGDHEWEGIHDPDIAFRLTQIESKIVDTPLNELLSSGLISKEIEDKLVARFAEGLNAFPILKLAAETGIAPKLPTSDEIAKTQEEGVAHLLQSADEPPLEYYDQLDTTPTLTEPELQEHLFTEDKAKAETTIKEQSSEIKKQIEELDEEVKVDELTKDEIEEVKSVQKGIEQAIDCVIKNIP